jgi:hypothetical protein
LVLGATIYRGGRPAPAAEQLSGAGLLLAFAEYFTEVPWLSRDITVLLLDAADPYASSQRWLSAHQSGACPEASFIRAGLFLDWPPLPSLDNHTLVVHYGT